MVESFLHTWPYWMAGSIHVAFKVSCIVSKCISVFGILEDTIRYLSLHDNKYIRYFPGHSKRWALCSCMFVRALFDVEKRLGFDILPLFLWPGWHLYACLLWMTHLFLAHWIKLSDCGIWGRLTARCVCLCFSLVILCDCTDIGQIKQPVVSEI